MSALCHKRASGGHRDTVAFGIRTFASFIRHLELRADRPKSIRSDSGTWFKGGREAHERRPDQMALARLFAAGFAAILGGCVTLETAHAQFVNPDRSAESCLPRRSGGVALTRSRHTKYRKLARPLWANAGQRDRSTAGEDVFSATLCCCASLTQTPPFRRLQIPAVIAIASRPACGTGHDTALQRKRETG